MALFDNSKITSPTQAQTTAPDTDIWKDSGQVAPAPPAAKEPRITPPDIREVAARVGKNIQHALSAEGQDQNIQDKWNAFAEQAQAAKPLKEQDPSLSLMGRFRTRVQGMLEAAGKNAGPHGAWDPKEGRGASSLNYKPPSTPNPTPEQNNGISSKGPSR